LAWMADYTPRWNTRETVTHLSTNWAESRATLLIRPMSLSLRHDATDAKH